MLQVRSKDGSDKRWIAADRDIVWVLPHMLSQVFHSLDEGSADTVKQLFGDAINVPDGFEENLGEYAQILSKFLRKAVEGFDSNEQRDEYIESVTDPKHVTQRAVVGAMIVPILMGHFVGWSNYVRPHKPSDQWVDVRPAMEEANHLLNRICTRLAEDDSRES